MAPLESSVDVTESDSQQSVVSVLVDSSESLMTESVAVAQSSSVQSQREAEGEEEEEKEEEEGESEGNVVSKIQISSVSGAVEEERPSTIVVGIVEPERAARAGEQPQATTQQVEPEPERDGPEQAGVKEDREAVGETRDEVEEGETTEEELGGEEVGHAEDATKEPADTTQKLEEGLLNATIIFEDTLYNSWFVYVRASSCV